MKLLAISCSPRVGGSCDRLIEEIVSGVKSKNSEVEVDKFKLSSMNIKGCSGCFSCREKEGCVQRDDMNILYQEIIKSDLILFASPVIMGYITGNGKNFLERLFALRREQYETLIPEGKRAVIVLTKGHESETASVSVADSLTNIFNSFGIKTVDRIVESGLEHDLEIDEKILQFAYRTGSTL